LPAIGNPMLPSPMKPIFAMGQSSRGNERSRSRRLATLCLP